MANYRQQQKPKPIVINKYLGQNDGVGKSQIKLGEWYDGRNLRVTKEFLPQKRPGNHIYMNFGEGQIQGQWYGQIMGKTIMIVCHGGKVYERNMLSVTDKIDIADLLSDGDVIELGTITDAPTEIYWFDTQINFINGTDRKIYDGATYQDEIPYIPYVELNGSPDGTGGTIFEEINMLSPQRYKTFIGDGLSDDYKLPETELDSIDEVLIDGVAATSFTPNLTTGFANDIVPVPPDESQVQILWSKETAGLADIIKGHKYFKIFGVGNDTNIFLFGNEEEKNVVRFSGVERQNYYAANSFVRIKSDEFAITDLQPQYQSMFAFKKDGTVLISPAVNPNYAGNKGLNPFNYAYVGLNDRIGNKAPNMVQLINDTPITLDCFSMRRFVSNRSVRNEVEPQVISERLQLSLQELDLSKAITFDYEFQKEYWVNVDDKVYIWNYENDTMYVYDHIEATRFIDVEGDIYLGTPSGTINHISENFEADVEQSGEVITCYAKGSFSNLGSLELRKSTRLVWASIAAAPRTSVTVSFETDKINSSKAKKKSKKYILLDFNYIDFNSFSFNTNRNIQPLRFKMKLKKYTFVSWIIENITNNETFTFIELKVLAQSQGYSK